MENLPSGTARDLGQLAGIRGVGLVVGLVEVVKQSWPNLPKRWVPLTAIVVGVILNVAIGAVTGCEPLTAIINGLEAGLAAVGLYQVTSRVVGAQGGSK